MCVLYKQILMPVVPAQANSTFQQSAKFLQELGANHLHLVHVMSEGLANRWQLEQWLTDMAKEIESKTGCLVTWELLSGHPPTEICETAENRDMDIIYQWSKQRGILSRTLLGSTSSDVLRMTEKPALIHKALPSAQDNYRINRILFATDFAEAASRTLEHLKLFSHLGAGLVLMHVRSRGADPATDRRWQEKAEKRLEELATDLQPYFPGLVTRVKVGAPGGVILEASRQEEVELMLLGRYNNPSILKGMGGTVEKVVNKSQASVLVIP